MRKTWDNATTWEKIEGPCELITRDDIFTLLTVLQIGKAAGPTKMVHSLTVHYSQ